MTEIHLMSDSQLDRHISETASLLQSLYGQRDDFGMLTQTPLVIEMTEATWRLIDRYEAVLNECANDRAFREQEDMGDHHNEWINRFL